MTQFNLKILFVKVVIVLIALPAVADTGNTCSSKVIKPAKKQRPTQYLLTDFERRLNGLMDKVDQSRNDLVEYIWNLDQEFAAAVDELLEHKNIQKNGVYMLLLDKLKRAEKAVYAKRPTNYKLDDFAGTVFYTEAPIQTTIVPKLGWDQLIEDPTLIKAEVPYEFTSAREKSWSVVFTQEIVDTVFSRKSRVFRNLKRQLLRAIRVGQAATKERNGIEHFSKGKNIYLVKLTRKAERLIGYREGRTYHFVGFSTVNDHSTTRYFETVMNIVDKARRERGHETD